MLPSLKALTQMAFDIVSQVMTSFVRNWRISMRVLDQILGLSLWVEVPCAIVLISRFVCSDSTMAKHPPCSSLLRRLGQASARVKDWANAVFICGLTIKKIVMLFLSAAFLHEAFDVSFSHSRFLQPRAQFFAYSWAPTRTFMASHLLMKYPLRGKSILRFVFVRPRLKYIL